MNNKREFMRIGGLEIHPLAEMLAQEPNKFFEKLWHRFGKLRTPVVTKDGKVISLVEDFRMAKENGVEEMEFVVADITELDVILAVNFFAYFRNKERYVKLHQVILYLKEKFEENVGNEWYQNIDGDKTRGKLSNLLNISQGKIQDILFIGKTDPNGLIEIDKGNVGLVELVARLKKKDKQKDGGKKFNPNGIDPTALSEEDPETSTYISRSFSIVRSNKTISITVDESRQARAIHADGSEEVVIYEIKINRDYKEKSTGLVTEKFILSNLNETITLTQEIYESNN